MLAEGLNTLSTQALSLILITLGSQQDPLRAQCKRPAHQSRLSLLDLPLDGEAGAFSRGKTAPKMG